MGKRPTRIALHLFIATLFMLLAACTQPTTTIKAELKASPSIGTVPLEVSFEVITNSDGEMLFDPGDGTAVKPLLSKSFRYVYAAEGNYKPKLIVKTALEDLSDEASVEAQKAISQARVAELPVDVWTEFNPEGDTTCALGETFPYKYFATPGKLNKLVIDFQGGGACWDDFSCSRSGTGTYATNVGWITPDTFKGGDLNFDGIPDVGGIYDREDLRNPIRDWHHIYIPYCTGDVHWGNATHTYTEINGPDAGKPNVIQHKGYINAKAVIDWVFANYEAPETILLTGCSAGAYGSMMWTPHIAKHYPDAEIKLMADCGAGIVNEAFLTEGFEKWNVLEGAWPSFINDLDPSNPNFKFTETFINDIYTAVGRAFPESMLSQFNTMGDGNQIFYYALMQKDFQDPDGDGIEEVIPSLETMREWLERMPESMKSIEASSSNFRSYLSMFDENDDLTDGTGHCIIFRPEFFDVTEEGKPLYEWLADLVNGKSLRSIVPTDVPPYETIIQSRLGNP